MYVLHTWRFMYTSEWCGFLNRKPRNCWTNSRISILLSLWMEEEVGLNGTGIHMHVHLIYTYIHVYIWFSWPTAGLRGNWYNVAWSMAIHVAIGFAMTNMLELTLAHHYSTKLPYMYMYVTSWHVIDPSIRNLFLSLCLRVYAHTHTCNAQWVWTLLARATLLLLPPFKAMWPQLPSLRHSGLW